MSNELRTYEKIACELNGVPYDKLFIKNAKGGGKNLPVTRFMCIWFAVKVLKENYISAAKRYGLHRTSYYHAKKTIEGYADVDPEFKLILDYFLKASKDNVEAELSDKIKKEIMEVSERGEHIRIIQGAISSLFNLQKALYDYISFEESGDKVIEYSEKCEKDIGVIKEFFSK